MNSLTHDAPLQPSAAQAVPSSHAPCVFHLGQVIVDLTLHIDHLPERGGDIFATSNDISVGGGYNVLTAIRRFHAPAVYMGALGTGPMADKAVEALNKIGVKTLGPTLPNIDTGYCVAMTEPSGERTFVSTRGAETMVPPETYESINLSEGDVVYLSGYSFSHKSNREAIERFARKNKGWAGTTLFDVGPMVADIEDSCIETLQNLKLLWSVNEREATILCKRFSINLSPAEDDNRFYSHQCLALSRYLNAPVILRAGAKGAWYCSAAMASESSTQFIPTLQVKPIDTNGAGDAHSGALCASILLGRPLYESLVLANCAGALSTTMNGPATCPSLEVCQEAAQSLMKTK